MAVTPLTQPQSSAILALVKAGRLSVVPPDLRRAAAFLQRADERLGQLGLLTSVNVKYDLAYDAAHDVGEALLATYGYRTTNGVGQHEALGRYLGALLDAPPGADAARSFDRLRRMRNQNHYEARTGGEADAQHAEHIARELYSAALCQGLTA